MEDQIKNIEKSAKFIANPKAVAAQAFKSKSIAVDFQESKVWKPLSGYFVNQYRVDKEVQPLLKLPQQGDWIIYPYAILNEDKIDKETCLVWDNKEDWPRVRHLRLYHNRRDAEQDNQVIEKVIGAVR